MTNNIDQLTEHEQRLAAALFADRPLADQALADAQRDEVQALQRLMDLGRNGAPRASADHAVHALRQRLARRRQLAWCCASVATAAAVLLMVLQLPSPPSPPTAREVEPVASVAVDPELEAWRALDHAWRVGRERRDRYRQAGFRPNDDRVDHVRHRVRRLQRDTTWTF